MATKLTRVLARRIPLYLALILGALVFSLPFLWLLSTSAKQEQEIFVYPPELIPQLPGKVSESPWIDPQAYRPIRRLEGMPLRDWLNKKEPLLEALREEGKRIASEQTDPLYQLPGADEEIAQGLWRLTSLRLAEKDWEKEPGEIVAKMTDFAARTEIEEMLDVVGRRMVLGDLRLDSWSLRRETVLDGAESAESWEIIPLSQGAEASLEPTIDVGKDGALLRYRLAPRGKILLRGVFDLPFEPEEFKKLAFSFRDDASWNAIRCAVEFNGTRYEAPRDFYFRRGTWQQALWQVRSWEDETHAQRPWFVLDPVKKNAPFFSDAGKIKVELTLERKTRWGSIYGKFSENYREALTYMPFWRYMRASVILVTLNIIGELIGASLVAFAFARLRWPGRDLCFVLVLSTLMVPEQVMMIPRFLIFRELGWYDTWKPLWAPAFFGNAFFIFLLVQFMRTIPNDLEDGAKIDGCGYFRIYWNVILPLIKPALAAISIFTFMGVWNNFMGPLIYLNDQRLYPLSLGLYALQAFLTGTGAARQGVLMAASIMMTVPVIAIFFAAQRHFIQGVTLTGMKG